MKNLQNKIPLISIIIPCRNEERFIGKCLDSILNQNYPKDKLEILVVDGMSEDNTRNKIEEIKNRHQDKDIRILDNPDKITPKAMNIGIKSSKGDIVVLVCAHGFLDKEFLKWNVYHFNKIKKADAVGGKLSAISEDKLLSKAISFVSDSVFGSGGVRYRQRTNNGFIRDTLPFCAYRKESFDKFGMIDESFLRGQDGELNLRILKMGGLIYFSPKIKSYAYSRPSICGFCKQQFQYGYFKVKIAQKLGMMSVFRQYVPAIFVLSLILSGILGIFFQPFFYLLIIILLAYLLLNIVFSLEIAFKKGFKYLPASIVTFFVLHFGYGLGFLKGIFDFLILKKKVKKDIGITR